MRLIKIKDDCRYFDGSRPCRMNKLKGYECAGCPSYKKYKERILIIKLDATGDVLRTTSIVPKIKEKFPFSFVVWITKPGSAELVASNPDIDRVLDYADTGLLSRLQVEEWDYVYNLDNSHSSAALAALAKAKQKRGFVLSDKGVITPLDRGSQKWLMAASFDKVKKENSVSYQEIIYGICGFHPPVRRPCLFLSPELLKWADTLVDGVLPKKKNRFPAVGINTGSGGRWPKKMLDVASIIRLIKEILKSGPDANIILLGGESEREKNDNIAKAVNSNKVINIGSNYSILQFGAIINKCDVILCADTLALHIASALNIPVVAVFGPTSSSEIYDYDGLILKMDSGIKCLCCYNDCNKRDNCMSLLSCTRIIENINKQINYGKNNRKIR